MLCVYARIINKCRIYRIFEHTDLQGASLQGGKTNIMQKGGRRAQHRPSSKQTHRPRQRKKVFWAAAENKYK